MFGRVGQAMDRNVIICLSVVAGILLLTGLAVAVTAPSASAQRVTRSPGTPPRAAPPPAARPRAARPRAARPAADSAARRAEYVAVSLYIGGGRAIEAGLPGGSTQPITISASIFGPGYWGAVRFLPS
jgi:hypothetical protein